MTATIVRTGHQCRCPRCKQIVMRGVRSTDSQWVAICAPCGHPPLEDIAQPPKAPLAQGTIEAVRETGNKEKVMRSRTSEARENGNALLERMDRIRDRAGLSWARLSVEAGESTTFFASIRHRIRNGKNVDVPRLTMVLDRLEKKLDEAPTDGESAPDNRAKAIELLEETLGVGVEELKRIRPQIDVLLAARRHNLPVRITVGSENTQ